MLIVTLSWDQKSFGKCQKILDPMMRMNNMIQTHLIKEDQKLMSKKINGKYICQ